MAQTNVFQEQLKTILLDPDKHGPYLEAMLEVVNNSGSKGLKKLIQEWIDEIKQKEGLE